MPTRAAALADLWKILVLPILLFLLAAAMLVYDNMIHPPGDSQGTSGVALVLIALSLGVGLDLARLKGGSA